MAAVGESTTAQLGDSSDALLRLVGALWEVPSVQRVTFCRTATQAQVWILLRDENRADFERAVFAEREYRREVKHSPLDFRFCVLPEIDRSQLPDGILLFERA